MTKDQSTSALRRRRQAIKKERAALKRELRAIEAEMEGRKGGRLNTAAIPPPDQ